MALDALGDLFVGRRIFFLPCSFPERFFAAGVSAPWGQSVAEGPVWFTVLPSTLPLVPPLGNLDVFLGNLDPPPLSFPFPGLAWESSANSGWELCKDVWAVLSDLGLRSPGGPMGVGGPRAARARKTKGVAVPRRVRKAVKSQWGLGRHNCRRPPRRENNKQPLQAVGRAPAQGRSASAQRARVGPSGDTHLWEADNLQLQQ